MSPVLMNAQPEFEFEPSAEASAIFAGLKNFSWLCQTYNNECANTPKSPKTQELLAKLIDAREVLIPDLNSLLNGYSGSDKYYLKTNRATYRQVKSALTNICLTLVRLKFFLNASLFLEIGNQIGIDDIEECLLEDVLNGLQEQKKLSPVRAINLSLAIYHNKNRQFKAAPYDKDYPFREKEVGKYLLIAMKHWLKLHNHVLYHHEMGMTTKYDWAYEQFTNFLQAQANFVERLIHTYSLNNILVDDFPEGILDAVSILLGMSLAAQWEIYQDNAADRLSADED